MEIQLALFCFLCCGVFVNAKVIKDINSTQTRERNGRYAFSTNRLPLSPDYQNNFYDPVYNKVGYNPNKYDSDSSAKYGVPSSFDDFVPGEGNEKYSYGAGGIYIPYSSKSKSDYIVEELEENKENEPTPKITTELVNKGMKVLTGTEVPAAIEVEERPTFLSVIRNMFSNPLLIVTIAAIPLIFIAVLLFPSFTQMFGNLNMGPDITSTIAGFARSMDGDSGTLSVERVLDVINEYGARSMEDPRCFQRFLCQAAKSGIESRSGDSWSVRKVIQKLAKSVDDRLWDTMGLKHLFNSLQSGNCNVLACTGSPAYMASNLPLVEKIGLLGGKLFQSTKVTQ